MDILKSILTNGTFRRWLIGAIGLAILFCNDRFHLGLEHTTMLYMSLIIVALVTGSNVKDAIGLLADAKVDAATAIASGTSAGDAAAAAVTDEAKALEVLKQKG